MAPSHYLTQCWLIIEDVLWHSPENNFTSAHGLNLFNVFGDYTLKIIATYLRGQWVNLQCHIGEFNWFIFVFVHYHFHYCPCWCPYNNLRWTCNCYLAPFHFKCTFLLAVVSVLRRNCILSWFNVINARLSSHYNVSFVVHRSLKCMTRFEVKEAKTEVVWYRRDWKRKTPQ